MSAAITIENLAKRYRVNHAVTRGKYKTLRDSIANFCSASLRQLRGGPDNSRCEDFWALKDVSFDIKPGESIGIVGRNGAGKSTLLKILSRITKPTKGQVSLRGRVGSLLEVGAGFHPELTGRENIYLNGAILGMSRQDIVRKFDQIVDFAEIEKFLDTPVKRYSSGMYVRLAFAVAAHLEPEILLVDEVLAVGDIAFQKKCLGRMGEVTREGRTVVFVSHDLASVTQLCGRGVLLQNGSVEYAGDIASVVSRYLPNRFQNGGGFAELHERGDRSGNGSAQFRSIELLSNGERCGTASFGKPLTIKLEIDVRRTLDPAPLSVIIATAEGTPVHDLWSNDCSWSGTVGKHSFRLTVPRLQLYPGPYVVDLWLGDRTGERVDYIRGSLSFEVVQTPEGGVERPLRRQNGLVHQLSEWIHDDMSESPN